MAEDNNKLKEEQLQDEQLDNVSGGKPGPSHVKYPQSY